MNDVWILPDAKKCDYCGHEGRLHAIKRDGHYWQAPCAAEKEPGYPCDCPDFTDPDQV